MVSPRGNDAPSVSSNRLLQGLPGCRHGRSHAVPILRIDFVEAAKLHSILNSGIPFVAVRNVREKPPLIRREQPEKSSRLRAVVVSLTVMVMSGIRPKSAAAVPGSIETEAARGAPD
jgi:hypothetical protein